MGFLIDSGGAYWLWQELWLEVRCVLLPQVPWNYLTLPFTWAGAVVFSLVSLWPTL